MNQLIQIMNRELQTFFDSLTAYVLILVFLGFSGFFTWLYGIDIFVSGQASLETFYQVAYWSLFVFIPALTMRSIAGEMKSGTLELLLTKPISDWELILGKFSSILVLVLISLAPTLIYYFSLWSIGSVDHSAIILGYVGLVLMSMVYISIGIMCSCLSSNPIVASISTVSIGIFFHYIFDFLSEGFVGFWAKLFNYLSLLNHFESISKGILDSKDLVFFFSIPILCLFSAKNILSNRKN